jgi:hypothetical protein
MGRNGAPRKNAPYAFDQRTERFRRLVEAWSDRVKVSPNAIFHFATEYGRTYHWMKERWLGGVRVRDYDLAWLEETISGRIGVKITTLMANELLLVHQNSVASMCKQCVFVSRTEYCPDRTCALRPVSPMPLKVKFAHNKLREWSEEKAKA